MGVDGNAVPLKSQATDSNSMHVIILLFKTYAVCQNKEQKRIEIKKASLRYIP
jgi:hypothetical protein